MRKYIIIIAGLLLLALTACDGVDDAIDKSKETLDIDQEETTKEETTTAKEREAEKEEKESKQEEVTQEEWDEFKTRFLEHYGEASILEIQVNPGSDYEVFNVYVPNEFKINTEEEKQYYVEEIGPLIQEDLETQFPDKEVIHVYFKYQDDNTMAKAKMFGGWKIK